MKFSPTAQSINISMARSIGGYLVSN